MEVILTSVAALAAVLGVYAAGKGALLARPQAPDLARHVRTLINTLSDVLDLQSTWYRHIRSHGTEEAAKDPYLSAIAHAVQELSRINETAVPKLRELREFTVHEIEAARARSWIELGTLLTLASAGLQLFLIGWRHLVAT
jgi:hypothetical protein